MDKEKEKEEEEEEKVVGSRFECIQWLFASRRFCLRKMIQSIWVNFVDAISGWNLEVSLFLDYWGICFGVQFFWGFIIWDILPGSILGSHFWEQRVWGVRLEGRFGRPCFGG